MDVLTFITKIVSSVAWPITVGVLLLAFRKQIVGLLPNLRKLKFGGTEAEFGQDMKVAEAAAQSLPIPPAETWASAHLTMPSPQLRAYGYTATEDLSPWLAANPTGAVMAAWKGIERSARDLLAFKANGLEAGILAPRHLLERLEQIDAISTSEATLFKQLMKMRNEAAHALDFRPTPDEVERYVELASRLKLALATTLTKAQQAAPPPQ